jgi:hypothetical protein
LKWTNGYVIQHEVDFDAVDENSMYISFVVSAEKLILEILLMTEPGLRLKDKFVNDRTGKTEWYIRMLFCFFVNTHL